MSRLFLDDFFAISKGQKRVREKSARSGQERKSWELASGPFPCCHDPPQFTLSYAGRRMVLALAAQLEHLHEVHEATRDTDFDDRLVISLLLCLAAGERNLVLRIGAEDELLEKKEKREWVKRVGEEVAWVSPLEPSAVEGDRGGELRC